MGRKKFNNKHANKIIHDMEMDMLEFVTTTPDEREKLLPITDSNTIKGLIWNLNTDKWLSKISKDDYDYILSIWFDRIKTSK